MIRIFKIAKLFFTQKGVLKHHSKRWCLSTPFVLNLYTIFIVYKYDLLFDLDFSLYSKSFYWSISAPFREKNLEMKKIICEQEMTLRKEKLFHNLKEVAIQTK